MLGNLKAALICPLVILGGVYHKLIGNTPAISYSGFRRMFYLSNGMFNDFLSRGLSFTFPFNKQEYVSSKLLGRFDESKLSTIVSSIEQNGYYVFDEIAPTEIVTKLEAFARNVKCELTPKNANVTSAIFKEDDLIATKYAVTEQSLIEQSFIQDLIVDDGLVEIAGRYINAAPINDLISMWWSTNYSNKASTEAAQLFHFDMDRVKFLKFFIYLSDVTPTTGPHIYVKGSHRSLPKTLRRDGRFSDQEIKAHYNDEEIIEIVGRKGTIVAVDTRGLHKGKPLLEGYRLIFQIEYANSTFGMDYGYINLKEENCSDLIKQKRIQNKRFFKRYQFSNSGH